MTNTSEHIPKRPVSRPFGFIMRTLCVLTVLAAIWLGFEGNAVRRQKAAVDELSKMQVVVLYRHQRIVEAPQKYAASGVLPFRTNRPNAPAWLLQLLGDDFFHTVTAVNLDSDLDNIQAALPYLKKLPHLQEVYISVWPTCGNVDSNELSPIEVLQRDLPNTKITVFVIPLVG